MATTTAHPLPQLERVRINFSWILKLRWAAAAGQLATILLVRYLYGIELPMSGLVVVLAFEALSNIVLTGWFNGASERDPSPRPPRIEMVLGSVMLVDILLLTTLLFLTGGPTNPFSVFFMVNIVLSAVVLTPTWTSVISAVALACFTLLFFFHLPLPELEAMGYRPFTEGSGTYFGDRLSLYLRGLLVATGTAAAVVAVFASRVTADRTRLEQKLADAERQKERSQRLESLGTLAAGAAHELASPLSTIAVIASDLAKELARRDPDGTAAEDARLIRQEVRRCREILDQMSVDAGQIAGEPRGDTSIDELLDEALRSLKGRDHVVLVVDPAVRRRTFFLPRKALALALRQIAKNGIDATRGLAPVTIQSAIADGSLRIDVHDRGSGMSDETLARATDPFFTTKEPGQGMGLGLFLSHMIIERLDGRIRFESAPGRGTTVRVTLPLSKLVHTEPEQARDADGSARPEGRQPPEHVDRR